MSRSIDSTPQRPVGASAVHGANDGSGGPVRGADAPEIDLADLRGMGAESETERSVKRTVPWIVSLVAHGALVFLGFFVTWTVVILQRDEEPVLIVADFDQLAYNPLPSLSLAKLEPAETSAQNRMETARIEELLEPPSDAAVDPLRLISDASSSAQLARFAPEPTRPTATFVGLSSSNARRIVYVIDASGSMIRSLPIVLDELARSLDGLTWQQEFSVVFFQRNEAVVVPPADRLFAASAEERTRVLAWIRDHVIPSGRSNPIAAFRAALAHEPDAIFLLSENITGSGEFEIDQADLLALLDELNPRDARTGMRRTQINCVQFLDPDPLGTLEIIAKEHGGERGYKFLDRAELGLKAP